MCGIAGIFSYQPAAADVDPVELGRIAAALMRRGPDGEGMWFAQDGRTAFAHRRLAVIDPGPGGAQPMSTPDGILTITFNGEIYNYAELRATLIDRGHVFRSHSDTEVLLRLYAERGPAMVEDLRGMFAFAIWDTANGRMFLARDPYGIKPLYYANDGWTFRFASQVKALMAGGRISDEPEPAGLIGFHVWGHVPEPFSLYREIRALPAGHTMVIDDLGPREPRRYWSVAQVLSDQGGRPGPSDIDLAEPAGRAALLRDAVVESVRHHLVADVEVGLFLSAGIDSGAILGVARDLGHAKLKAITLAFSEYRGTSDDETPLAAQVAAQYGADHIVRVVDEAEFQADLPAILDAMDQPSIDGINTWFVAKAAKETGLRVALSGLGGDELLGGYPSFADLPRWHRRFGLPARIPGLGVLAAAVLKTVAPGLARRNPKALGLLRHAGTLEGCYLLRRALFLPEELPVLLDPAQVRDGLERLDLIRSLGHSLTPEPGSTAGCVTALESSHYMRDQLLRDADWAGMAQSVEIRTPLVDASLLRDVAPIIPRLAPGEGKQSLARAPREPVPDVVVGRAKTGFTVPTGAWMAQRSGISGPPASKGIVSRRWSGFVLAGQRGTGTPHSISEPVSA